MKTLLLLLLCTAPLFADVWQERKSLQYLNGHCADTWCEGTYQYTFTKIECGKVCTVHFKAKRQTNEHEDSCKVSTEKYSDFQEWLVFEYFHEWDLAEPFMSAIDECLERFEWLELEA
jgi:hypothetical protein